MKYLQIQLKKLGKQLPMILLISMLTVFALGVVGFFVARFFSNHTGDTSKVGVGIVGEIDSSYMNFGIQVLNTMDSSGTSVRFESLSEEEAKMRLQNGSIIGYFRISNDFIEGLSMGENRPIQFVSSQNFGALMYHLGKEVASTLTTLLVHSELAVYAMENYYTKHPSLGDVYKANEELNKKMIFGVLERKRIYQVKILDSHDDIEMADYYFGGMLVFYLLLSGLGLSVMFTSKDRDLLKLLHSRNIRCEMQIICEHLMMVILNVLGSGMVVSFALLANLWLQNQNMLNQNVVNQSFQNYDIPRFFWSVLLVIWMISAMQTLFFEWVKDIVPAMLLQFILALALAFSSGILYPLGFFPKSMQSMAIFLPSRQAMLLLFKGMGYPVVALIRYYSIGLIAVSLLLAIWFRYQWVKKG